LDFYPAGAGRFDRNSEPAGRENGFRFVLFCELPAPPFPPIENDLLSDMKLELGAQPISDFSIWRVTRAPALEFSECPLG
jgi:hypothetical protein